MNKFPIFFQCENCDRWLHTDCDNLETEDDMERACDFGYFCPPCRKKTARPGPLPPDTAPLSPQALSPNYASYTKLNFGQLALEMPKISADVSRGPSRQHLVDGFCVSERARNFIQEQSLKYNEIKKPKKRGRGARGSTGVPSLSRLTSIGEEDGDDKG